MAIWCRLLSKSFPWKFSEWQWRATCILQIIWYRLIRKGCWLPRTDKNICTTCHKTNFGINFRRYLFREMVCSNDATGYSFPFVQKQQKETYYNSNRQMDLMDFVLLINEMNKIQNEFCWKKTIKIWNGYSNKWNIVMEFSFFDKYRNIPLRTY